MVKNRHNEKLITKQMMTKVYVIANLKKAAGQQ